MNSNFKGWVPVAAFVALLFFWGCQTQVPPTTAYLAPNSTPNYTLVCNFDNGAWLGTGSANTSSNLYEVGEPGNIVQAAGTWTIINNFPPPAASSESATFTVVSGGANGTSQSAHITGTLNDAGDGIYPSVAFEGYLDTASGASHNAYDMSFFSGVQFYINFTSADTTTSRFFYIPTTQEAKSPQGDCADATGCYNYFGYTFPTSSTNGWVQYRFNFATDLAVTPYGKQPTPATLTGINLKQVLGLLWQVGRQNSAGPANIDFYVDEVYFY